MKRSKYKKGQFVKFKTGKGKPHRIKSVRWQEPFYKNQEGWYVYTFDDGTMGAEDGLIPYIDKYLLNKACKWLRKHAESYIDMVGDIQPKFYCDMVADFKEDMLNTDYE